MTNDTWDLAVIGAGPGGYVAAIRAAQLGMKVVCIEKDLTLGGTCLNVGCIPSKALLESSEKFIEATRHLIDHGITVGDVSFDLGKMMARKDKIVRQLTDGVAFLFKKNKISVIRGTARFLDAHSLEVKGDSPQTVSAKKYLIAAGGKPSALPGVAVDGTSVCTSTEALAFDAVPARLAVIGAGVIGLELGSVWNRLGSEVTIIEYLPTLLPGADPEIAKHATRLLKRQGLKFVFNAEVTGCHVEANSCTVDIKGQDAVVADKVLSAVGRKPDTEALGLAAAGVAADAKGFIKVDENYQTSSPGIYAVGDAIGGAMLAHKASEEGIACVEKMVTGYGHVNYEAVPCIVYTDPEIAWVGKNETELQAAAVPFKRGSFSFKPNGRALALGSNDGMVKVLAHAETDRLLGVHIIGPRAGDLLAEAVVAMEYAASSEDLARAFHAHPTLSEAIKEAALDADGRAIHN